MRGSQAGPGGGRRCEQPDGRQAYDCDAGDTNRSLIHFASTPSAERCRFHSTTMLPLAGNRLIATWGVGVSSIRIGAQWVWG